jgi:hypothetical protein
MKSARTFPRVECVMRLCLEQRRRSLYSLLFEERDPRNMARTRRDGLFKVGNRYPSTWDCLLLISHDVRAVTARRPTRMNQNTRHAGRLAQQDTFQRPGYIFLEFDLRISQFE